MRSFFESIAAVIVTVVLALGIIASLSYYSLQMAGYFQPKYEQVRRSTFIQSQAYNDGMRRDFENLQMEYAKADDAGKAVIRSTALHRFAVYDIDRLPADLRVFYFQLKAGN